MFKEEYESDLFFIENMDGNAQCIICACVLSLPKHYFLKRHYLTCHGEYEKLIGRDRVLKMYELQASFFLKFVIYDIANTNVNDINCNNTINNINDSIESIDSIESSITNTSNISNVSDTSFDSLKNDENLKSQRKASFKVALALAKQCRPFDDGTFFLNLTAEVLECFGEQCKDALHLCQNIPLSRFTMARRTEDISHFIYSSAKNRLKNCKYFSIALDESTDVNNICQLIICIKTVNENLETFEEVFDVISLHGHVTGQHLYDAVKTNVFAFAAKQKLSSLCTDGAKVMRGEGKGLLGLLRQNEVQCPAVHCVIHQQALFAKQLNVSNTMQIAIKIINKIRGGHNALSHRKFKQFLEDLNSDYGDLLLHTEVRWLSKGKSLERLFNLRNEILIFFKENHMANTDELISALEDEDFLLDLAFLCDITGILNELNISLQGKNINVIQLSATIKNFNRKLILLINQLKCSNTSNLKKNSVIISELKMNCTDKIKIYAEIIESLKDNYAERFQDLKCIERVIELHNSPLCCSIEDQCEEIQGELRELREDLEIPLCTGEMFWKNLDGNKYKKLKTEIFKLYSMFGTTYNCEVAFSSLKIILSKARNRLSDRHVTDLLRIKEYRGHIDVDELIGIYFD